MSARFDSLQAWLSWQGRLHSSEVDLGLDRIRAVLARLSLDFSQSIVVTVAGTNGKGSTLAFLESIYRQAGYRVGLFTSPHFLHYCERIRIDGDRVSEQAVCDAFAAIDSVRGEISLTYFEFSTLAALWLFARESLAVILLEVGLGGRLDASNVIDADVGIVTSVSIDHRDWLGDNREDIGREKAGIYRRNRMAISGDPHPPHSLREVASIKGSDWQGRGEQFEVFTSSEDRARWRLQWRGEDFEFPYPERLTAPIQLDNAASALVAVLGLRAQRPVDKSDMDRGLCQAGLPGRLQVIGQNPEVMLDVAHNEAAAKALFGAVAGRSYEQVHLVLGMLQDKEVRATASVLEALQPHWYLATPQSERAMDCRELAAMLPGSAASASVCYASVTEAYRAALGRAGENDLVIVTGSFFTVAEVMGLDSSGTV
ncbi:FolC bifunctional protein [gamma proteobacterium HTCC5015]|nr:FolC bifunctional protein [gamma proteobacterium HTCC5015]